MKRLYFSLVVCLATVSLHAQFQTYTPNEKFSHHWFEGLVVFSSGDTLRCNLRYNYTASASILQIADEANVLTLTPEELISFEYYDEGRSRVRKFMSVLMDTMNHKSVFVESLFSNEKIMLLSHKTVGIKYKYMQYTRFVSKPSKIINKYIFNIETGQLLPLSKRNALQIMADRQKELEDFITDKHLKFNKTVDYVQLLQYHSSL